MSINSIFGWINEYRNNNNTCDINISVSKDGIFVIIMYDYRGWQYTCEKYCFDPRDNTYIDTRHGLWKKNNRHWKECSHDDWAFIFKEIQRQISIYQEKAEDLQRHISGEKLAVVPIPQLEARINELKGEIGNLSWLA